MWNEREEEQEEVRSSWADERMWCRGMRICFTQMRRTMIEELFSNSQVKLGNFVFQKAAKVFASSLALNKKKNSR